MLAMEGKIFKLCKALGTDLYYLLGFIVRLLSYVSPFL
jgi:hypothetical protein